MEILSGYLFKGLNDDQLGKITDITEEISMEKGQEIFTEGENSTRLYILRIGAVELFTRIDTRVELPVAMMRNPGDIFGSGVLIDPYIYTLTARCAEPGGLLSIEGSALKSLMKDDHDLGCIVMTNLAGHFLERLTESRQEIKTHFKTLLISYR